MISVHLGPSLLAQSPLPSPCAKFVLVGPTCGDLWGRVDTGEKRWWVLVRRCPSHPSKHHVAGSFFQDLFWLDDPETFIRTNPALLLHEFEATLNWIELT